MNELYFSMTDLYPGLYLVPTVTEISIPDPAERAAYAESNPDNAGVDASAKKIPMMALLAGIALFLVVGSLW